MPVVIQAGIPLIENCPVFTRIKCFVTQQGIIPTIEHVFRDDLGNPRDLTEVLPEDSQGDAVVEARIKEAVAPISGTNPLYRITGKATDLANGVVRATVTLNAIPMSGIYSMDIGIKTVAGELVAVDSVLLWVEPSLFVTGLQPADQGPPTLIDFRMELQDSCRSENLLLDGLEFGSEQFAHALCKPIEYWNAQPPPIRPRRDTRNFPYREAWMSAAMGHLFEFSANNYRRNHLSYQAGGVTIDDKNKEQQYLAASERMLNEWKMFVASTKMAINAKSFNAWID